MYFLALMACTICPGMGGWPEFGLTRDSSGGVTEGVAGLGAPGELTPEPRAGPWSEYLHVGTAPESKRIPCRMQPRQYEPCLLSLGMVVQCCCL